jgi:thiamine-monophosphate kinase
MHEFDLIARIRARTAARDDVLLGIGDDAALLQPRAGMALALCCDTFNAGVHFPAGTRAGDVGWKALAVNLSDLAAMGATPRWALLALSLPAADAAWLDDCLDGLLALAAQEGVALVGGDTTRGPLSLTVTAAGEVEAGTALRRAGAQAGDEVWVSGTLGDAAAALAEVLAGRAPPAALRERLDRPVPRIALGQALRGVAHAAVDVSDGLLADLGHVCRASGVHAEVELAALPQSPAFAAHVPAALRAQCQATVGDDYELCFTAPVSRRAAVHALADRLALRLTCIGRIVPVGTDAAAPVRAQAADGSLWSPPRAGHDHFASG